MGTLLQRALATVVVDKRLSHAPTQEEVEVAVAFLNDEISATQFCTALGKSSQSSAGFWASSILRRAVKTGLVIVRVETLGQLLREVG